MQPCKTQNKSLRGQIAALSNFIQIWHLLLKNLDLAATTLHMQNKPFTWKVNELMMTAFSDFFKFLNDMMIQINKSY